MDGYNWLKPTMIYTLELGKLPPEKKNINSS